MCLINNDKSRLNIFETTFVYESFLVVREDKLSKYLLDFILYSIDGFIDTELFIYNYFLHVLKSFLQYNVLSYKCVK